jgi:hypothetical protein
MSYALEAFMEGLSAGKKPKDLQASRADLLDIGLPDLFGHPCGYARVKIAELADILRKY